MFRLVSAGSDLENNAAYRAQRQSMLSQYYKPVGVVLGDVDQVALSEYVGKLRTAAERIDDMLERGLPIELVRIEPIDFGNPVTSGHTEGKVIYARSWVADSVRKEIALQAPIEPTDAEAQREIEEILSKPTGLN